MSIPAEKRAARLERFGWAIRLSPIVVAVVLAALWLAGAPRESPDLRFAAPVVARPGSSIGLRAWQMDRDREGHIVVRAPEVRVELADRSGLSVARSVLSPSAVQGVEGSLDVPGEVEGELRLIARAPIDGGEVRVERTLYVRDGIDSKRSQGRLTNAFEVYELGPLHVRDARRGPSVLDPRIAEGACVPDLPCSLVVWVGDWEGRVRLRSLAGVRIAQTTIEVVNGFVHAPLVVSGAEGRIEVAALCTEGTVVASREVRLPLVPGGLVAWTEASEEGVRLDWQSLGGRAPVLVDVFAGKRWVRATSLTPEARALGILPPGVWRLQVKSDLFSGNTAAVVFVAIGGQERESLEAAADAVLASGTERGLDPLARDIVEGRFSGSEDRALQALFAVPSFDVVESGIGVSARVGDDEGDAAEQDRRRFVAAGFIVLLGFVVSMALLRVELLAQARAEQLLDRLGEGEPAPRSPAFGRGLWAFVLLVFVLMAVLALSKRWF